MKKQPSDWLITIPYHPRLAQRQIHPQLETHRFCVLVTHRQLGKTVCAVNHLLKKALQNTRPHPRYFYLAPFLKQAKMIAWDDLKRYSAPLPGVGVNEAELCLRLPNGARIWVCGADNPDALRGTYADGVVLDEYAQIKPDVFTEIIRPMLLSREGWAVFMGTPKGQNAFFELFNRAQKAAQEEPGVWWVGVFRADESGVISPGELERLRRETPANIFRQEYLCDFTASAENVLIPIDCVLQACARRYAPAEVRFAPKIIGIDPARFGNDRSVIFLRQGLKTWEPLVFRQLDNMALAERAARQGVRIFTIGIGTPEGAPIQIGGEFIKDEKGEMVVSKLNEEMLARIADITGGAYVRATKQSIGLDEIVKTINEMEQTELSTIRFEEFNEQYQYLLIVALVLLLVEFLVLDRRNPLLAHLNIFREK